MKVVCIIPARGGSKGIPRKNVRLLAGMPLLAHSIRDAAESEYIEEIYVSTEDAEIAAVAREHGAGVIVRPMELAGDSTSSELVLKHALAAIEQGCDKPELIVFLQCTSPVRSGADIDAAIRKFVADGADSLLSVTPFHGFLWEDDAVSARPVNYDFRKRPMRQEMEARYKENGSIYILKPWVLKETNCRLGGRISLFVMDDAAGLDIDTPFDLEQAEFIMGRRS